MILRKKILKPFSENDSMVTKIAKIIKENVKSSRAEIKVFVCSFELRVDGLNFEISKQFARYFAHGNWCKTKLQKQLNLS